MLDAKTIAPEVSCVFPLAEVAAAHDMVESNKLIGKVVPDLSA
ncbi:zinc-binding dehydrogenase [Hoeflea olei]|nr:zinc-binding dehydrogenase [Hoeflea olei]